MTINAIIFDMDDTLYAEKQYVESGFKAVGNWLKHEFQIFGFYEAAWSLFESGEKSLIFNKALEQLNVAYDDARIKNIVHYYRSHEPDIDLLDDAKWILEHLKDTIKIGLISDGYLIAQEMKVHALKLDNKFHSVVLSDKWGREHWKPSQTPYIQSSQELQVPYEECVYIGDNVKKDFIGAKRLGWTTIHIDRKNGVYCGTEVDNDYSAHYTVNDLRSLSDLPMLKHMFA